MTEKMLGQIKEVKFGFGGYQDAQIGIWFTFEGKPSWGCGTGEGYWAMSPSSSAKWTKKDQVQFLGELILKIVMWLEEAKVSSVDELQGIPVEVEFENSVLKSWRILTEVL